jgi:ABC-type nickel/cobalt efflux system permease component RcnA
MGRCRTSTLPRLARTLRVAVAAALVMAVALPGVAAAHPLGNFTINHYAGLFIEPERVLLDVVIDQAEIPAFSARQALDTDGDGEIGDAELETGRVMSCEALTPDLTLSIDGVALTPVLLEAGLAFPPGLGGLQTMRTVCGYVADLPATLMAGGGDAPARVAFMDGSFPARLGWREIVVVGSGVAVSAVPGGGEVRADSLTDRLTVYPEDLIAQPLADGELQVDVAATVDAPLVGRPSIDDATPVPGAPVVPPPASAAPTDGAASPDVSASPSVSASPDPIPGVPGGVGGGEVPSIFREANLTPVVLLLSVMTAIALGAGHALTPGHGKTLMAAYLVGTRGRPLHAVGLGLSVSISHTAGILVLAALVVGAADVLPADVVVRAAPVVASISILAIGAWMLAGEWRRRRSAARAADHDAGHTHDGADAHAHDDAHEQPHDHDHEHEHPHPHPHEHEAAHEHAPGEHSHGGIRHSHLPPAGATITWRSLFVLGLAGGLIPSTSALLILLGSIAAGRTAFGLVLVVAFGLGMAAVMTSIGLVLVFARERLDGMPASPTFGRFREAVPLVAAVLVFGFGIYLTVQAISGAPTL